MPEAAIFSENASAIFKQSVHIRLMCPEEQTLSSLALIILITPAVSERQSCPYLWGVLRASNPALDWQTKFMQRRWRSCRRFGQKVCGKAHASLPFPREGKVCLPISFWQFSSTYATDCKLRSMTPSLQCQLWRCGSFRSIYALLTSLHFDQNLNISREIKTRQEPLNEERRRVDPCKHFAARCQ